MFCRQRGRKECRKQVWAEREMLWFPDHTLERLSNTLKQDKNPSPGFCFHQCHVEIFNHLWENLLDMHHLVYKMVLNIVTVHQIRRKQSDFSFSLFLFYL